MGREMPKSPYLLMGSILIFLFISLSFGLAINTCQSSANTTANEETKPMSAFERIQVDYEAEKLTVDQYLLYKAWAISNPSRLLDTEYAVSPEETRTSGRLVTMLILEAKENWHKLSHETREQLNWIFLRPTDSGGGIDYAQHLLPQLYHTTHFVIHYTTGTDGGRSDDAPDLTDVNPPNGWPDYVENYASYFEYTYTFEVGPTMFNAPPSDAAVPNDANNRNPDAKYDVFIYKLGGGFYGYTDPEQYPNTPSCSYIAVNKNYDWASNPYNEDPDGVKKGAMKVTAAHEFFHAIQFFYDCTEEEWWMETSSTYMEDEVYPAVNDNYYYLPNWFQASDYLGLESTAGLHEYGNFIFAKRLSEDFGDAVIKEIWTEMQATDGLTAIDNVLTLKGSSIESEFNKFTRANFFLEDMYVDGADYRTVITGKTTFDGVQLEYEYNEATEGLPFTINNTNANSDAWMTTWAADYVTITMSGATPSYMITFDGLDNTTQYDISLVTKTGIITSQDFTLNTKKDGRIELTYDSSYTDVVLIIRNSGNTSTKYPSWRVIITPKGAYDVTFYTSPALDSATITFDNIIYTNDQVGSYNSGDFTATANLPHPEYVFDHWEYSGSTSSGVYVPNNNVNPTNVEVKGNGWLRAVFKATVYRVTVRTSGLTYSFDSTHVYVDDVDQGTPYLYDFNSRTFTFAVGETHTISVEQYVWGWTDKERYYCQVNSTTVNTDATVVFDYNEENLVTFDQQGCGGTPQVTVDDVVYSLPVDLWLDAEAAHTFGYESPVAGDVDVQYVLSWTTHTSPYKFMSPTTVKGNYNTQYFITINSEHGAPTDSKWVNKGSYFTVSVMSPTETLEGQTRWVCSGYKIDEGELQQGTSYSFWSVGAPHKIEFYWVQQFWLQVDTGITGQGVEGTGWYDTNTFATISVIAPYQPSPMHQFIFTSWASTGTNNAQITDPQSSSTNVTMSNYYSVEAKWQEQWYITVISDHGNPTPSQWVNANKSLSISVTSPADDDGGGTRYRCTGFKVDDQSTPEGTGYILSNVQAAHTIIFQWTAQYQLIVKIDPAGLSPQPTASPSGPWYDASTIVTLTAKSIDGYTFDHWEVDGESQGSGINSITVNMFEPKTAIAYYKRVVVFPGQLFLIAGFVVLAVVSLSVILLLRRRRRKML